MALAATSLALGMVVGSTVGNGSAALSPLSDPAFADWFKDSKVADARGNPRVVFHGTPQASMEQFDAARHGTASGGSLPGFHFSASRQTADSYRPVDTDIRPQFAAAWDHLNQRLARLEQTMLAAFNRHHGTAHVEWQNLLTDADGNFPLYYRAEGEDEYRQARQEWSRVWDDQYRISPKFWKRTRRGTVVAAYLSMQEPFYFDARRSAWTPSLDRKVWSLLREQGLSLERDFDGLILDNIIDPGDDTHGRVDTVYAVWRPSQIKSVDNRGTWSDSDPRISFNIR